MKTRAKSKRREWALRGALALFCVLAVGTLGWFRWVYSEIERYAAEDQAALADAIGVFGAAEWDGRPSPVYRARLEHARSLYQHGIAPLIITMGGDGGDDYSEGGVGKEYLRGMGIPEQAIIAETESRSTADAAKRIAVIARANGLKRLVIVSDPTHLFRIHAMCTAEGLEVLTSPRPRTITDERQEAERIGHEMLSYTAWRLHLH
jgi:uncharacterized SAM-binding protein YcdF (DUF218 family)